MGFRKKQILLGIFILSMFLIGFFLRAQETLSGNYLFLLDSGRDMMDVKKIVFDHKFTLIGPYTSLGGVFQGPLYYYLLAIPTAIFNGNPWGNILLMLLISLLVLICAFYFMNKYFGLIPALITFVLFIFCPEAAAAATYFWNPHPMWILLTLYTFVLYGATKKSKWMQFFLMPLISLTFHFEMAFGVFLFVCTILYILFMFRSLFKSKPFWLGVLSSGILFIPQVLFDLRHDFLMSKSVIQVFQGGNSSLVTSGDKMSFTQRMMENLGTYKNNYISAFVNEGKFQLFPVFTLVLSIGTFLYSVYKKMFTKDELLIIKMLLFLIFFIVFLGIIYPFPLRYWFLTGFQSFYLVLTGLVLSKLFKFQIGKVMLTLCLVILLSYSVVRLNMLYFNPPNDGGFSKIKGKIAAVDYVYGDAKYKDFGVIVFTPPVLTDAYDYVFWWYGQKKYNYLPHNKKKGVVYLVIEPDPSNPWSYKGWLETVIKTGKIVDTKTIGSGIIVQKRIFN